jgi:hypothetical protein
MASESLTIFLFDVDGVIVNPLAYRAGITQTLLELCEKIGLQNAKEILPNEPEIAAMEAQGVHDVWDITNIIFCDVLTTIALQARSIETLSNLPHECTTEQLHALRVLNPVVERPDYMQLATSMAATNKLSHPPDIALSLLSEKLTNTSQSAIWTDLLKRFLNGTRSAYSSYGTRLFQNIILGPHDFEQTYKLGSEFKGAGLLRAKDKTLINQQTVDELLELNQQSSYAVGVYTARPSLPPKMAAISPLGYSPEAEIALESAGMQFFPLIGMGMMEWLAKEHGERTEDLTKPNATQALAALINTISSGDDVTALRDAYAIDKQAKSPKKTHLNALSDRKTTVYVFEDTISGILPLLKTEQMLRSKGFNMTVEPLGIATDPQKRAALENHCSQVFDDVNAAFEFVHQAVASPS